jgi:hypothetical protein
VSEWFKEPVLKTGVRETVPWVRIPPHPPEPYENIHQNWLTRTRNNLVHFAISQKHLQQWCNCISVANGADSVLQAESVLDLCAARSKHKKAAGQRAGTLPFLELQHDDG